MMIKKLLIIVIAFGIASFASAQQSAIMPHKMNVFYIGVPNPITVAVAGYDCRETAISIDGATIKPREELCQYDVYPEKPGIVAVQIHVKDKEGINTVGSYEFRVKYIPDPVAQIGGKAVGQMRLNEFKAHYGVVAALYNFDFDVRFRIASFTTQFFRDDRVIFTNENTGMKFDERTREFFSQLRAGDRLEITNVKTEGPDKIVRDIDGIRLTLK